MLSLVLAVAACGGGAATPPSSKTAPVGGTPGTSAKPSVAPAHLWSFDPKTYFRDGDFTEASVFTPDLVILAKAAGGGQHPMDIIALDPRTGAERWRKAERGWLLHPPGTVSPLYFVPLAKDARAYTQIQQLDPQSGAVRATVALAAPVSEYAARFAWSERALLAIDLTRQVTAFDWTTGAARWRAAGDERTYLAPLRVVGDRVVLSGSKVLVLDLADGKLVAEIPGACCGAIASPDGRHLFVRSGENETLEVGPDFRVLRTIPGVVRSASNRFYVVEATSYQPTSAAVFMYGQAAPLLPLDEKPGGHYSALAVTDRHAYYFHPSDARLVQRDLGTGQAALVAKIGSHFIVSPDATGTSGPYISTPPIIAGPYLFYEEHGVHAYRIDAK